MEAFSGLLVLGIIIGVIVYYVKKNNENKTTTSQIQTQTKQKENEKSEEELLKEKWDKKKKEFLEQGLPTINSGTLCLTKNEICHFESSASFCKLKQQVVGYQGGSRGFSVRVIKGLSFRVGNHRGHYIKEEIKEKTNGTIYLTSKKIIFSALKNSCVIKYKDIVNLNIVENMIQFQTEKKTYLFQIVNSFDFMLLLECLLEKEENN